MMTRTPKAKHICQASVARSTIGTALKTALVVGTILTLINQWEAITGAAAIDWFKLILTYIVPYCVATYSAAVNLCRSDTQNKK